MSIAAQVPALAVLAYLVWQINQQSSRQLAVLTELIRSMRESVEIQRREIDHRIASELADQGRAKSNEV